MVALLNLEYKLLIISTIPLNFVCKSGESGRVVKHLAVVKSFSHKVPLDLQIQLREFTASLC